jgi:hypothetical protein
MFVTCQHDLQHLFDVAAVGPPHALVVGPVSDDLYAVFCFGPQCKCHSTLPESLVAAPYSLDVSYQQYSYVFECCQGVRSMFPHFLLSKFRPTLFASRLENQCTFHHKSPARRPLRVDRATACVSLSPQFTTIGITATSAASLRPA